MATVLSMINIVWTHEAECPKRHLVMVHSSLIYLLLAKKDIIRDLIKARRTGVIMHIFGIHQFTKGNVSQELF